MKRPSSQLSLYDAARLIGVSYFTARRMVQDGRLAGGRVGRGRRAHWFVTPKAVVDFLRPASRL